MEGPKGLLEEPHHATCRSQHFFALPYPAPFPMAVRSTVCNPLHYISGPRFGGIILIKHNINIWVFMVLVPPQFHLGLLHLSLSFGFLSFRVLSEDWEELQRWAGSMSRAPSALSLRAPSVGAQEPLRDRGVHTQVTSGHRLYREVFWLFLWRQPVCLLLTVYPETLLSPYLNYLRRVVLLMSTLSILCCLICFLTALPWTLWSLFSFSFP